MGDTPQNVRPANATPPSDEIIEEVEEATAEETEVKSEARTEARLKKEDNSGERTTVAQLREQKSTSQYWWDCDGYGNCWDSYGYSWYDSAYDYY